VAQSTIPSLTGAVVKHAGQEALDSLESLLSEVRKRKSLTERSRGVFYLKSVAFLHFHEDPAGMFADLRMEKGWTRFPVSSQSQRRVFLSNLARVAPKT